MEMLILNSIHKIELPIADGAGTKASTPHEQIAHNSISLLETLSQNLELLDILLEEVSCSEGMLQYDTVKPSFNQLQRNTILRELRNLMSQLLVEIESRFRQPKGTFRFYIPSLSESNIETTLGDCELHVIDGSILFLLPLAIERVIKHVSSFNKQKSIQLVVFAKRFIDAISSCWWVHHQSANCGYAMLDVYSAAGLILRHSSS